MADNTAPDKDNNVVKNVASCVIEKDDRYLLVQGKLPHVYGLWNLPGGHVDSGETIEQAAIREAKEESGYDVVLGEKVATHKVDNEPRLHAFRATIVGGELKIQVSEILDAKWFTYEEIKDLHDEGKIRDSWAFEAVSNIQANA